MDFSEDTIRFGEGMRKMNDYSVEELLPVVSGLTEKYTSKESTSVTYEQARQLMGAVLYCIGELEGENQVAAGEKLSAPKAYQYGYEKTVEKVKQTQWIYNSMILHFNAFGNKNYNDTVTKALPGFFRLYDVRFAPQETIITMDYPTLQPIQDVSGIDAVERYVEYIVLEQRFMGKLPETFVLEVLQQFHEDYQRQFYNICRIILRHILTHMLIGKPMSTIIDEKDFEQVKSITAMQDKEIIVKKVTRLLEKLIDEKYDGDKKLLNYLSGDIQDYCTELSMGILRK